MAVKSLDQGASAKRVENLLNTLHLGNVVNITDTGGSGDLCRVLLVLFQLRIDILRNVGERFRRILGPEEIFGVEVVRAFLGVGDDHSVQFHVKTVGYQRLISPTMGNHWDQVDVTVKDEEH